MRIVIISVIIFIAFGSAVLSQTPCDEISKYSVRFAIIGDRTGDHQEGVYEAIVAEVERLRPDFVMTVGDHIEGYISDTIEMNRQWDEYFGIIKPLTMPVHITPGNHDITSDAMEPTYRGRVGAPYYSFDHRGIHFVVLDNSRWETAVQFPAAQLNWLKDDLAKNRTACYTFVFFHKPFWYNTLGAGKPDPWHEVFKANGVDAVFTGHFHTFFSAEFDGIKYTSFGSSGGETEESPDGLLYQFGWVTVDGSGVYVAPVKKGSSLALGGADTCPGASGQRSEARRNHVQPTAEADGCTWTRRHRGDRSYSQPGRRYGLERHVALEHPRRLDD